MSLRVLTASPAERLVSVATLKTELGISGSSEDAKLSRLLNAVSRAFAGEVGYPLQRQRYTETASSSGRRRLVLTVRPIDRDSVSLTLAGTASTDFSIEDAAAGILYRSGGWPDTRGGAAGEEGDESNAITFKGGWVLPEFLSTWVANDATIANATTKWIRPTSPVVSNLLYEVTTAGTLGETEPTWPTTAGVAVTSGDAELVGRDAHELPADIYEVALITALSWRGGGLDIPAGIQAERRGGVEIAYDFVGAREAAALLPAPARSVLAGYR